MCISLSGACVTGVNGSGLSKPARFSAFGGSCWGSNNNTYVCMYVCMYVYIYIYMNI